jgi:FAD/FMN-containing dehydrogenase
VKNVTGYDLPRLVTGSHGELGMIATVTMKLWPTPPRAMTFTVDDAYAAHRSLYKPLAVIDTEVGARVYVEGSDGTIADARARIGDDGVDGLVWPTPVAADVVLSIRVPARSLLHATEVVRGHGASEWRSNVGVGVLTVGFDGLDEKGLAELRDDIAGLVGIVVVERWPHEDLDDRWGVVPEGIEVQRRLKALFDPDHILNLGLLPGDL